MKKNYQKPTMNVVKTRLPGIICGSGEVGSTKGNANFNYVGSDAGYDGGAHSRSFGDWDDDE